MALLRRSGGGGGGRRTERGFALLRRGDGGGRRAECREVEDRAGTEDGRGGLVVGEGGVDGAAEGAQPVPLPRLGSRISETHLPHRRCRTPR